MNVRRVTAVAVTGAVGLVVALLSIGTSPATGAHLDPERTWAGQRVASVVAAQRIAGGGKETLTLVDQQVRQRVVDVDVPGDSPGDFFLLDLRLFDETGQAVVGRGSVRCEQGISTTNCQATLRVYKQGQITVSGCIYKHLNAVNLAITGGVGQFKGAGGTLRSFDVQDGNPVLVLTFVR